MSTTIYVFSATGNSLTTAWMLADKLENCRVVSAASMRKASEITETSDAVGFVFPVYYGDMPCVMREMIAKMVFGKDVYLFSVSTYRGHAGKSAERLNHLLESRGAKLSLALGIAMPGNSYINAPEIDQKYLSEQKTTVEGLAKRIICRDTEDYSASEELPKTPVDHPNNFRGIMAEEACIGCGTCAQVCPMENIVLRDGKARIGDQCSTCLACFHWCPVEAIYMSKQENIARRSKYHHPDVTVEDIIAQKSKSAEC